MAATLIAAKIAAWRTAETKLRSARLTGIDAERTAARTAIRHQLDQLAHDLDCSGHGDIAAALNREAILAPMVRARRAAGVDHTDLARDLSRVRARIRAAR